MVSSWWGIILDLPASDAGLPGIARCYGDMNNKNRLSKGKTALSDNKIKKLGQKCDLSFVM